MESSRASRDRNASVVTYLLVSTFDPRQRFRAIESIVSRRESLRDFSDIHMALQTLAARSSRAHFDPMFAEEPYGLPYVTGTPQNDS